MKNNKGLFKIIALVMAIGLIGAILFVTNSFIGNPVSASFAKKAAKNILKKLFRSRSYH